MPYEPNYRGTKAVRQTPHEIAIQRLVASDDRMCRNGFKREVRSLWAEHGGDEDEMAELNFLPDAFLIDRDARELRLYEVEDTSALKPNKKALYGWFWFLWDSEELEGWSPRLFVCSPTGRVSYEVPLPSLYYDHVDAAARGEGSIVDAQPEEMA